MELVDTHCHLVSPKLRSRWDAVLDEARAAGVTRILDVAYDPETVALACEHASTHTEIFALVGIQPHDAKTYTPEVAEEIGQLVRSNEKVVGIGEIGLDGFYTLSPMDLQITCYRHFLDIARRSNLPVAIHMRETFAEVIAGLRETPGVSGVIHCFTGTLEQAREFLDLGMFLSLSGIVTFPKSVELQDVARFIPADRLLIETDSPYLAPQPMRGKLNIPAYLSYTCEFLAKLRGTTPEEMARTTRDNAFRAFPRLK